MQHRVTSNLLLLFFLFFMGCASIQETERQATVSEPKTACQLTANELQTLKASALNFLIQEWPVLDKRCERISDTVVSRKAFGCSIMGGPRTDESCEPPSHVGYGIVFVKETLQPTKIFWLSE